jgi:hypothetical protein
MPPILVSRSAGARSIDRLADLQAPDPAVEEAGVLRAARRQALSLDRQDDVAHAQVRGAGGGVRIDPRDPIAPGLVHPERLAELAQDRLGNLLVRTSVPPATVAPAVAREFRGAAPGLPTYDVKTMEERLAGQTAGKRLFTGLMIASAALALLLSVVGIYGVISCVAEQRTRELGVRMALGATAADLRGLLVGQGLRLALAGIACGLLAALAFHRLAGSVLHGLGPLSPALLAGAALLLVGAVALTCYLPVRRALKSGSLAALTRDLWTG